jgi:hypothetical protein
MRCAARNKQCTENTENSEQRTHSVNRKTYNVQRTAGERWRNVEPSRCGRLAQETEAAEESAEKAAAEGKGWGAMRRRRLRETAEERRRLEQKQNGCGERRRAAESGGERRRVAEWKFASGSGAMNIKLPVEPGSVLAQDCEEEKELVAAAAARAPARAAAMRDYTLRALSCPCAMCAMS